MVYEGEQEGSAAVAQHLLGDAIHTFFPAYFPKIEKLEKEGVKNPYTDIIEWFFAESGFELLDDCYNVNNDEIKETNVFNLISSTGCHNFHVSATTTVARMAKPVCGGTEQTRSSHIRMALRQRFRH